MQQVAATKTARRETHKHKGMCEAVRGTSQRPRFGAQTAVLLKRELGGSVFSLPVFDGENPLHWQLFC